MQADPDTTDEYVPPGVAYKFCLFVAFVCGIALIVPVHQLTAKRAVASDEEGEGPSVYVASSRTAGPAIPALTVGGNRVAYASTSPQSAPFEPVPAEPMPIEPLPLEPMPLEPMPEELVSLEPQPFEATPFSEGPFREGSTSALRQPPAVDDAFVYQDQPAPEIAEEDPVPPPPASAGESAPPMPAVAADPVGSPSDAMPNPAVPAAMPAAPAEAPMPAVVEAAPVVDAMPMEVAPIPANRPITCTSPVPEPVVLRATSAPPQQVAQPQGIARPYALPQAQPGYGAQPSYGTQPTYAGQQARPQQQAAQPRPQVYRPTTAQPLPQPRQSFNHPGYGTSNFGPYTR